MAASTVILVAIFATVAAVTNLLPDDLDLIEDVSAYSEAESRSVPGDRFTRLMDIVVKIRRSDIANVVTELTDHCVDCETDEGDCDFSDMLFAFLISCDTMLTQAQETYKQLSATGNMPLGWESVAEKSRLENMAETLQGTMNDVDAYRHTVKQNIANHDVDASVAMQQMSDAQTLDG